MRFQRLKWILSALALLPIFAARPVPAQFASAGPEDHKPSPGTYKEDPFITKYRKEFFSVYTGDVSRFERAMSEIEAMVKKNPKDARALIWLGNGTMIRAGFAKLKGDKTESEKLLHQSKEICDKAVKLAPENYNIYLMRAVTFYLYGQYWPDSEVSQSAWQNIASDLEKGIKFIGPERMPKVSTHVRGEIYGELGVAYTKLGEKEKARTAFQTLIKVCPDTKYAERAEKELAKLG